MSLSSALHRECLIRTRKPQRLRAEKEKLKVALKVKHDQDLQIVQNPSARCADGEQAETASTYRYLRINTIKWTLEEAESWLTTHGYNRLDERPKESDLQCVLQLYFVRHLLS